MHRIHGSVRVRRPCNDVKRPVQNWVLGFYIISRRKYAHKTEARGSLLDTGLRWLRGSCECPVPSCCGAGHDAKDERSRDKNCKTEFAAGSIAPGSMRKHALAPFY